MIYLLLIIILVSILYYKYNDITKKYLNDTPEEQLEDFNNYSLISNKGIIVETPLYKEYTIGSGEIDTPYFHFANAIENITNEKIGNKLTQGTHENLELLNKGKLDFALCQENILYEYTLGLNDYKTKKNNIECVCALYDELYMMVVAKSSTINKISDLKNGFTVKGENYIIGTTNDSELKILKKICELFKIKLVKTELNSPIKNEPDTLYYITEDINTNFNLFLKNKLDALFYISGPKMSYIANVSQLLPIKFLPFDETEIKIFNQINGNILKKRNIKTQENIIENIDTTDVETLSTRCMLVCRKNIKEDVVYTITKNIFDNLEYLKNVMDTQSDLFKTTVNLENTNSQDFNYIDTNNGSYLNKFKPLEMFYVNKNINYHKGSYEYYTERSFINIDKNTNCDFQGDKNTCNLLPHLNKKNYYWKYKKIPGLETEFIW